MRKLVTFRTIDEVKPHTNADRLELVMIGGWQCIVKKGEFDPGDMVVFFEIDSLLPIRPEFEFLRQYSYVQKEWLKDLVPNGEGFRLKTVKLRQEISQGLVIPIPKDDVQLQRIIEDVYASTLLNEEDGLTPLDVLLDMDLSEHFGVIKYDPPEKTISVKMGGRPRGGFPSFIPKTDQERIQNINYRQLLESIKLGECFEVTQKMDGSSLTCFYLREDSPLADEKYNGLGICSRNIYLKHKPDEEGQDVGDNAFVKIVFETGLHEAIEKVSKDLGFDIAVQGELIGEGIQDNIHGIKGYDLYIFDIFDINKQKYLPPNDRSAVIEKLLDNGFSGKDVDWIADVDISHAFCHATSIAVEDIKEGVVDPTHEDMGKLRQYFIQMGSWKLDNGNPNEGIVLKSHHRNFSFKAVSNDYLLFKE